jgi:hypothetical protein
MQSKGFIFNQGFIFNPSLENSLRLDRRYFRPDFPASQTGNAGWGSSRIGMDKRSAYSV